MRELTPSPYQNLFPFAVSADVVLVFVVGLVGRFVVVDHVSTNISSVVLDLFSVVSVVVANNNS